jgi:metallophosphoesterase (TIGR00282 family)
MRVAFIGDIVGRPGREILKQKLLHVRKEHEIDFVIANCENVSHGFGVIRKNAEELLKAGVDFMTGGNHTWDKKEIISMFEDMPLIRPLNYPEGIPGSGYKLVEVCGEKLAIINTLGHYGMPMVENPFTRTTKCVESLQEEGIKNIIIDFHAESTAEKRGLYLMLQGKISALFGTHTHIGTDDLCVEEGTCYVSDVGLSGCRDNVIGMDKDAPIKRMTTGLPASFDIPKKCKKIMQLIICDIEDGKCIKAQKLRFFDDKEPLIQEALYE